MKILFVNKRLLFPTNEGSKIRTLNVVRHLARWHEVTYLCSLQPGEEEFAPEMTALGMRLETVPWRETPRGSWGFYRDLANNLFSRYPFNVAKDYDSVLRARAQQLMQEVNYDLLVCDFVQMALNCIGLEGVPRVLFQHNVEAQIFRRHAESDPGWARRRYMAHQWRKMRRFEAEAGRRFDAVIAVSPQDQQLFENEYGWRHVFRIDTAVDLDYFYPNGELEQPNRLVFVGSMDWLPNHDGVSFFVREIWPVIRQRNPGSTFQIVGRNPSPQLQRLCRTPGVEVVGTVPDVRPYISEAAVVVVPLLVGGGTRLKIFEAMAMGKAIVSTSLGAEGLPIRPGEHLVIADSPDTFASEVSRLLADAGKRSELGRVARQFVCDHFSAEKVAREFDRICCKTVEVVGEPLREVHPTL